MAGDGASPEVPVVPQGVATAESLREQPSATEPVAPTGGNITSEGTVVPVPSSAPRAELPTTGTSFLGGIMKKLNPFK